MLKPGKSLLFVFALLVLIALLTFIPKFVSASQQPDTPLPAPVSPEPYPNSELYPAEVYLATSDDLQMLYRLNIDFEGIQPVDGCFYPRDTAYEPTNPK